MPANTNQHSHRGLTLRAVAVTIVALFLMAAWIEYEELYSAGGPLAENSPPNSAVGIVLLVLGISAVLYKLRRTFRLATAELVVIYAALVLAAPLMTQGLWHRVFGLINAIPHHQDFKSYQSLPSMLWPHGPNLLADDRRSSVVLSNNATREFTVSRSAGLVPGESHLFSMLVKLEGLTKGAALYVNLRADDGPERPLFMRGDNTAVTLANPDAFECVGINPVTIPAELKDRLTLVVGVRGEGIVTIREPEFINVEAVEAAFTGRQVVRASQLAALPANQRNSTVVRPDNLFSLAGVKYLVIGFIPVKQWIQPAIAWSLLIAGLFAGFLAVNILMRKQWVEHERFTFPLTILPKSLLATEQDAQDRPYLAIFRHRIMWIGFAIALPIALLKGLHYYFPSLPNPDAGGVNFNSYVSSPVMKALLQNVGIGQGGTGMGISLVLLAIALLIETDILFSLWSMFLLFQFWNFGGKAFNLTRYAGYPWDFQQAMGGFIMYALLAVFVGRHHLANVWRTITGRQPDPGGEVMSYRSALLLLVAAFLAIVGWGIWTKMGAGAALLFFGYMFVCGVTASKVRAECGAPFAYLTPYHGMQFVAAIGGFTLLNPTGMLVSTIVAGFMCTSCFLLIAPAQVEMIELGRHFQVRPRDIGSGLMLGLLGGLLIGGFVVLCWVYGFGANNLKQTWPYEQNWYFNQFRAAEANADRAFIAGTLGQSPETQTLNIFKNPEAKGLAIGAGITVVLAVLRAKFMWFPFHPLGYILASSYLMRGMWFTFFLAWVVRLAVFRIGGAQTIRRGLVPFCVGLFLAAVTSVIIFDIVGIILRIQGIREVYAAMP